MSEVDAGAVHHLAADGDDADVVLAAVLASRGRHARTRADRLMHPHAADAGVPAVAHDLLGRLGPRDDHDTVHAARNGLHIGIAAVAVERRHVRVYREHIVS